MYAMIKNWHNQNQGSTLETKTITTQITRQEICCSISQSWERLNRDSIAEDWSWSTRDANR